MQTPSQPIVPQPAVARQPIVKPGAASRIQYLHTHHDRFMFHKVLGILSLASFLYRFWNIVSTGNAGFTPGDPWTLAAVVLHSCLAVSSLIFKVPLLRNKSLPMIFKESQLHAIIFSLRSLSVMVCLYLGPLFAPFRGIFILLAHYCADEATARYKQGTMMRDMPYPPEWSEGFRHKLNLFYSYSQILAIVGCFLVDFDGPFLVLFPIQIAALLMTLVRKSIISSKGWHVFYALSLSLAFIYSLTCLDHFRLAQLIAIGTTSAFLRFRFRVNKYVLWVPLCLYTILECDVQGNQCLPSRPTTHLAFKDWPSLHSMATGGRRFSEAGNATGEKGGRAMESGVEFLGFI